MRTSGILAVGNLQSRKNLVELVWAFGSLRDRFPEIRLVIAGQAQRRSSPLLALVESMGLARYIVLPGSVPGMSRRRISGPRCASAFVYPSTYEGFGLPILEAMACETPVVALNGSSVPEVAGNAALLVDPRKSDGLAAAISQVLDDRTLANHLVARGRDRVARFSWAATAQKTLQVYRMIEKEDRRRA